MKWIYIVIAYCAILLNPKKEDKMHGSSGKESKFWKWIRSKEIVIPKNKPVPKYGERSLYGFFSWYMEMEKTMQKLWRAFKVY